MEFFGGILAAILVAILISAIFYYALKARGPWGSFWSFFLVLLLIIWAAELWVRPIGPVYWGIAWVPLFFIGLIFALLLAAVPTYDEDKPDEEVIIEEERMANSTNVNRRKEAERAAAGAAAIGWIFWVFIIILTVAIIIGYL